MGVVTTATVIYDDGTIKYIEDLTQVDVLSDQGRVAFEYGYGDQVLPAASPSNDGMWRYSGLLPLDSHHLYPLPVGGTPLI